MKMNGTAAAVPTAIPPSEVALTRLVSNPLPATIPDVVTLMQAIDNVLPSNDGLKWFNKLYLMVTQEVMKRPPAAGWNDPAWLTRLDVIFAGLYFSALRTWGTSRGATPSAWTALLESRYRPDVARIQFALAGMNAHINHDLPPALIQAGRQLHVPPREGTREYADYQHVNDLLVAVEPAAMQYLATGILGEIAEDLGKFGQVFAMWSVRKARDTAWHNAEILWDVRGIPTIADRYMDVIDGMTGFAGRGLLTPVKV
jgi:hypothetical protein